MKKLIAAVGAACASILIFTGCGDARSEYSRRVKYFVSMNAEATLLVSDIFTTEKEDKFGGLCKEIGSALDAVDSSLSVSVNSSSISAFNAAGAGETVSIDYTAFTVLSLAKEVYELTDGYYNPAIYYNVQAYGFNSALTGKPASERIPSDEVIEKYNALASHFGELELIKDGDKYYAKKPAATVEIEGEQYSMKVDLGGIGKGYAVDEVNRLIDSHGFKNGYFSFGASSIAVKEHYLNGVYNLSFTNPRADAEGNAFISTTIKNKSISTSGDYEQYFLYDSDGDGVKERYCHVFDPTTGKPVQTGIMSATVIGGSAAQDDALTTAIMAMGKQRAVEFINEKLSDREVVFSFDNGGKYEIITNVPDIKVEHSKFEIVSTIVDGKIVLG